MGRNCFILCCQANKWRKRNSHESDRKMPSFFRFPKSPLQLEEWKRVIPPREYNPRDPTEKDYLCSLHFKIEDVLKYFEIHSIKGCPKSEVVKIERGTWALKADAVPHYFCNDNPDAKRLVHCIRRATNSTSERDIKSETTYFSGQPEDAEIISGANMGSITSHQDLVILGTVPIKTERLEIDDIEPSQDKSAQFSDSARLDHSYHIPLVQSIQVPENNVNSPLKPFSEESINTMDSNTNIPIAGSFEQPTRNSRPNSSRGKLKYDPYTIERLHQDVLEIALPKSWIFFQNDDDFSTEFIFHDKDTSVKSVKFSGSCHPKITIRDTVMEHRRVNSRQDIEELLIIVSVL